MNRGTHTTHDARQNVPRQAGSVQPLGTLTATDPAAPRPLDAGAASFAGSAASASSGPPAGTGVLSALPLVENNGAAPSGTAFLLQHIADLKQELTKARTKARFQQGRAEHWKRRALRKTGLR